MKTKAFTLIELLVVISIIGILSGLIAVGMNGATTAAADSKKKATVDSIKKSLVIDKVGTGTYPIETGCTIGTDCTSLDPVLLQYLPSDLGATYTYESDGSDCTISTILSTGYAYQYNCIASSYSLNAPISGACGSSHGANLSSIPTANFCSDGSTPTVSGSGPWTWTCVGIFGGTNASCSTGNIPLNGACGSAHGSNYYAAPTTNLCTEGTPSAVSGSGPWTWECTGSYTGTSPVCAANISVNGVCGSSNGTNVSTAPTTNLCSDNSTPTVSGSGPWTWGCNGTNGGTTTACSTGNLPVNGACGSASGAVATATPTTNLCTYGNPTTVSGSGPWTWNCNGLYTGTNSGTCTANLAYSLSATGGTGGSVSCTLTSTGAATACSGAYASGTGITITANPSGSHVFSSWTCSGNSCSSTSSNPTTITLTTPSTVTATFKSYTASRDSVSPSWSSSNDWWVEDPNYQGTNCGSWYSGSLANNYRCPTTVGSISWSCVGSIQRTTTGSDGSFNDKGTCCPSGTTGLQTSYTYYPAVTYRTFVCVQN